MFYIIGLYTSRWSKDDVKKWAKCQKRIFMHICRGLGRKTLKKFTFNRMLKISIVDNKKFEKCVFDTLLTC